MAQTLQQWLASKPTGFAPAGFVHLPECGDLRVPLRRLTLGEMRQITAIQQEKDGDPFEKLARVAKLCLCDEAGLPYDGPDPCEVLPVSALKRVVDEAVRVNVVDVGEAKKPSPPTPSSP